MEKTIQIDGKEVKLKSSAAIPRMYRNEFGKDVFKDMVALKNAMDKKKRHGNNIPIENLEMFENIAPENNIVFIFHVNSCPTTQELGVHHKTFSCVIIIFFFRYGRRKHNN